MVKLTPEQQSVVVEAEPEVFRPVPGGWGKARQYQCAAEERRYDDAQERAHAGLGQRRTADRLPGRAEKR